MTKLRILGRRADLPRALRALEDIGIVHLTRPSRPSLRLREPSSREVKVSRQLRQALAAVEKALELLGGANDDQAAADAKRPPPTSADILRGARLGGRSRRRLARLAAEQLSLGGERALLEKYGRFVAAFRGLIEAESRWEGAVFFHIVLRTSERSALTRLRTGVRALVGDAFEIKTRELPGKELAVLLIVPGPGSDRIERLLAEARVQDIPTPASLGGRARGDAAQRITERLGEIAARLRDIDEERGRLRRQLRPDLVRARAAIRDLLAEQEATAFSATTSHAFVLEGWVPAAARRGLEGQLRSRLGDQLVVEAVSSEEWTTDDPPVVLSNPPLLRPFEAIIRLLPLPRYGSLDPTPFVAVFFPLLFGAMVGDVGYGLVMAIIAAIVRWRARRRLVRDVAHVGLACATLSIVFGFGYGELFGDLGQRWFGLEPLVLHRAEAVVAFLGLAIALGVVHVVLGMILGVVATARHEPRKAVSRGASAAMILILVAGLLAAFGILPKVLLRPSVIALIAIFPVLVVMEGVIAPMELLATLGNILSYARVMALGTASVMLAIVANRMVGEMGSVVVGVVFALVFHLVNFALAVFSPAIHALRLHYVEFFGKFYSPGGVPYRPFGHASATTSKETPWQSYGSS